MGGPLDMSKIGEEIGGEAIKLTSTLKDSQDGGALEVLQAVLNSSNASDEVSRNVGMHDEAPVADGSETSTAASVGQRFGW